MVIIAKRLPKTESGGGPAGRGHGGVNINEDQTPSSRGSCCSK